MDKEKAKSEFKHYSEQLVNYQKTELVAIERIKTAEVNLEKAKTEFAEAKDYLAVIRGGIEVYTSELQRLERDGIYNATAN